MTTHNDNTIDARQIASDGQLATIRPALIDVVRKRRERGEDIVPVAMDAEEDSVSI